MRDVSLQGSPPRVLLPAHYFLPANKAGGPPKSMANLIDTLAGQVDFEVICCNHDFREKNTLLDVPVNCWTEVGGRRVFYQSSGFLVPFRVMRYALSRKYSAIYFNSFFDSVYTILPLLIVALLTKKRIYMSPRGEFSLSALALKSSKKSNYLKFFKALGLHRKIIWLLTSDKEKHDVVTYFDSQISVEIIPNLPSPKMPAYVARQEDGGLKLVYLARIAPMKNTRFVFEVLSQVKASVVFHLYGPIEDDNYWRDCLKLAETLPKNIRYEYCGEVEADKVVRVLQGYDLYFLPTLGENFGHSIFEAATASLSLLISDQTPWRNLANEGVGYDLPLSEKSAFVKAVEESAVLSPEGREINRQQVYQFACNYTKFNKGSEQALALFSSSSS